MRTLIPDSGLRGPGRLVWIDAKYKAHLQLLVHRGWSGLEEGTRDAHRADLHQALAYAALDEVERVDSLLVYPDLSPDDRGRPAIATVASLPEASREELRARQVSKSTSGIPHSPPSVTRPTPQ